MRPNDDFVGEIEDLRGSGRLPDALATERPTPRPTRRAPCPAGRPAK